MNSVKLTVNGEVIEALEGTTILEAAKAAGIYIPALCYHPDLAGAETVRSARTVFQGDRMMKSTMPDAPGKGCGLCVVEVEGEAALVGSCGTEIKEGMVVVTDNDRIKAVRRENLIPVLTRHPHACITCAQREGCGRSLCSANVPENERCCLRLGHCELQDVADYIGVSPSTPKWVPTDFPILDEQPLFVRNDNLCIGCTRCVRACAGLRGVEAIGFVYDEAGQVRIGSLGPTLEASGCRFCTACVAVCPTGALMDKSIRPGKVEEDPVPCREACPAHVDVPGYLRLIAQGKRDEANAVIREKVPFPGILGRVCIHPCEEVCRRGRVNQAVSICALKRYAADGDNGLWKEASAMKPDTGKRVAVIGAGPAGLTAAFYLRKQGHGVTLFEAREKAGGMMRYGIPAYRLPRDILDREIKDILDTGVELRTGEILGRDFTLDRLQGVGFDAAFLALGAQLSRRVSIDGVNLSGVLWGVDFLRDVADGKDIQLKDRVVVIGGGNVAVDVALTAFRMGAGEVTVVCLERREEMPAHDWEIEGAVCEGIKLMPSWGPDKILNKDGVISGIRLCKCISVFDEKGDFSPIFCETTRSVSCDQVIMAMGQATDFSFLENEPRISSEHGFIVVDRDTLQTGREWVYAGGDAVDAPGAVIHAVAAGRRAAGSIHKTLGGGGEIDEILFERDAPCQYLGRDDDFAVAPREPVPEIGLSGRHDGFREVLLGFTESVAVKEAKRCLQCDLRLHMDCNPSPPEAIWPLTEENINQVPGEEGVFQLYDEDHTVLSIKGTANMRKDLLAALEDGGPAAWFDFEADKMFSRRESELIQQYLQAHGRMPGGDDDDLF